MRLVFLALRGLAVTAAVVALMAAAPTGALAHSAQLPGSADRPVLTRGLGDMTGPNAEKGGTRHGTNKGTNKSNTGTRSASKATNKTTGPGTNTAGTQTADMAEREGAAVKAQEQAKAKQEAAVKAQEQAKAQQPNASVTGTNSVSKATTAGTNTVGTQTQDVNETKAAAAAAQLNNNAAAPQQVVVAGFQQPMPLVPAPVQAPTQVGVEQAAAGPLGLQNLPSTSTAALPAGTIAILTMGGALYAIRRKYRK